MPDFTLVVHVSRAVLGLVDLDINDHERFYVAPGTFGAQLSYNRQQIGSPWTDGQVTVNRSKQMVQEPVVVEVLGDTFAEMFANIAELLAAFTQDHYQIKTTVGSGNQIRYSCEAADYQIGAWVSGRLASQQAQVTFTVPRQPVPAASGLMVG